MFYSSNGMSLQFRYIMGVAMLCVYSPDKSTLSGAYCSSGNVRIEKYSKF